ncbi:MAG TPA: type I glyceraldehyde-3-phosphate dehydrogenase [Patescibacteria group bacterium]
MGKIAINGFGRIGRVAFRILYERGLHKNIVAVNDLTDAANLAYLLKYDSNYGVLPADVKGVVVENRAPVTGEISVDDHTFSVTSVKEPQELPWKDLGVDVVIESTGRFTDEIGMRKHIAAGAKRVILSAPVKDDTVTTVVRGVNEDALGDQELVSNASCTTNCITPVAAVIEEKFGIEKAMMTTIHSYTASQAIQDAPNKDYREGRAAAQNMVPTSTGATKAAAKALPALQGIFLGLSVRVPTAVGSLADFTFVTKKDTSVEEVKAVLQEAGRQAKYKGILEVTEDQIVLTDIVGNPASAIVDLSLTQVVGGNLVKVVAWYDNEWGYANRLVDQVVAMAGLGKE